MSGSEKLLGTIRDVVLPVDVRSRYDVYFSDRRVAIVCMGKAERIDSDTDEVVPVMTAAFGVPAPISSKVKKPESKVSIDEEVKDWSLDDLLKLSKKSCFYTNEEIEDLKLVWGKTPKFVILSKDCESKFAPSEEQLQQLVESILSVEGLKDKLWISGKWSALCGESLMAPVCKFCGSSNDPDALYCQSCGKSLEEETANDDSSEELTCSRCGTQNKKQASFCKQCGIRLR